MAGQASVREPGVPLVQRTRRHHPLGPCESGDASQHEGQDQGESRAGHGYHRHSTNVEMT